MSSFLAVERLHARHPTSERNALRDVSLEVRQGEILVLVGPNGAGKSTLLSVLSGELAPRQGRVSLEGRELARMSRRALARRIARLPQEPACPEGLLVEALVECGRYAHRGPIAPLLPEDREAVRTALSSMELGDMRQRAVETLSGGERRRAWLAMVFAQRADVLLLDEPTAALDLRHQWEVLDLLRRANRETGLTIVTALHDLEQAAALGHRVAVLYRGRVYDVGPPERCMNADMLCDVFGVDGFVEREDEGLRIRIQGRADAVRAL